MHLNLHGSTPVRANGLRCAAFAICVALGWIGCQSSGASADEVIARVGDQKLVASAVRSHVPTGLNPEDSVRSAERFVDQWIREQIIVLQAQEALPPEAIDFESELATYRNALLLHAFKERYASERLNVKVSEAEAMAFYAENEQSFVLTDYAIRVLFINAPSGSNLNAVREPFASMDSTRIIEVERWCVENGAGYALDGSTWWTLSAFTKEVPMNFYRTETQLASRRLVEFEANDRTYLVQFLEHALKDHVAPFSAVQEQVTEMIVHRRRQALLLAMEEQLVVKAWAEGRVERFK